MLHSLHSLTLEEIRNIVLTLAGIIAIVSFPLITFPARKNNQLEAVIKYFQQGDAPQLVKARENVFYATDQASPDDSASVCSFFHFWGLMVKKKILPIWVFESASGVRVVQLHQKLRDYIAERRKDNPYYAEYFEWLSQNIQKKYRHQIDERS